MKFHRLITFITLVLIIFYAAVPLSQVAAAQPANLQDAKLQVTVSEDPDFAGSANAVGLIITVANTSVTPADNVVVEDQLNPDLSWKADNAGCKISASGLLACSLGALPAGKALQVSVIGTMETPSCASISSSAKAFAANSPASTSGDVLVGPLAACYPLLKMVKTASAGEVSQGQPVSFTLSVTNSGGVSADSVVIHDVLPANTGLNWSIVAPVPTGCAIVAGELTCNVGSLAKATTFSVAVTSETSKVGCGRIHNTATVTSFNEPTTQLGDNTSSADILLKDCPAGPMLSIDKKPDAASVMAGTQLGFHITVTNSGGSAANNVVITDQLDPALTWQVDNTTACAINAASKLMTCSFASLAAGASTSVHVTATPDATICREVSNVASVEAGNFGKITSGTAAVTVDCPPTDVLNVKVIKIAENDAVEAGGLIQFTITVTNTSLVDAQDVVLSDVLPNGGGFDWTIDAPAPAECAIVANTLTCTYPTLAAGASQSVTVSSLANAGICGSVENIASVTAADEPKENLTDNTASAKVDVNCVGPHLMVVKMPDSPVISAKDPIGYTITVTNVGDSDANNVVVEDQLEQTLAWSETTSNGCTISGTQYLTCSFPTLEAGASATIKVTAITKDTTCTDITNTAYAQATGVGQVSSRAVVIVVSCTTGVNVKITKTAPRSGFTQGQYPVIFDMVVKNDSSQPATGVVLTDTLPTDTGLSWSIAAPVAGCSIAAGVLTCNFGTLAAAETRSVQITSPSLMVAATVKNTAKVSATNETDTPANKADNQSSASVLVSLGACLNLNVFGGMYSNTFENAMPGGIGIQNYATTVAPKGQKFLGEYASSSVGLTVTCLPQHTHLLISFDLYIIRSWDGNTIGPGPDHWKMELAGRPSPLIDTTFSNYSWSPQAYPANYPLGNYPYHTGAVALDALGYVYDKWAHDAIYHLSFIVPHTGDLATFKFTGYGLQPVSDESWGLDNITVVPVGMNEYFVPFWGH